MEEPNDQPASATEKTATRLALGVAITIILCILAAFVIFAILLVLYPTFTEIDSSLRSNI